MDAQRVDSYNENIRFQYDSFKAFARGHKKSKSVPIGALKYDFPPCLEIMTDRPTDQQTDIRTQREVQQIRWGIF